MMRSCSCSSVAIPWSAFALIFLEAVPASAVTLAKDGQPAVAIVLASDPIPAEQTAVQELAAYLEKATGGKFTVIAESEAPERSPAIDVGPTVLAKRHGMDAAGWGPEQWAMRTVGDNLLLVGGRPRGTLYAVYRFLEDAVGVRWWSR
jgi:hypothetical protein